VRRTVELDPQNGDAHRNLAVALGLRGRLDDAIREAGVAQRLLPESREVADHLARLQQTRAARDGR
jgi:Flp pilus assembly protein TadD